MFSIFQRHKGGSAAGDTVSPDSLLPRRMDLEERKAFRRDLLDQVIRESLQALEVGSGSYRFRIMPLDVRHHRFVAMIDVAHSFQSQRAGAAWNFPEIETFIRKQAFERFGLLLEGIYWRVGGTTPAFERRSREREAATAVGSRGQASAAAAPNPYQLVSDEEKQALMEAIRKGGELPVLHVGDREYQSEMAPLDDEGRSSGTTRYGDLD